MKSITSETRDDKVLEDYYWPDGLVPVTPQARRFGFTMDVYVTKRVWGDVCVWTAGRGTHTDARLFELLTACFNGLGKALAKTDDMLYFQFKHWYKERARPRAKKRTRVKLGARLLLNPSSGEPWLLLFHPEYDFANQLKKGEPSDAGIDTDI